MSHPFHRPVFWRVHVVLAIELDEDVLQWERSYKVSKDEDNLYVYECVHSSYRDLPSAAVSLWFRPQVDVALRSSRQQFA